MISMQPSKASQLRESLAVSSLYEDPLQVRDDYQLKFALFPKQGGLSSRVFPHHAQSMQENKFN
jgi:hypothetical protein